MRFNLIASRVLLAQCLQALSAGPPRRKATGRRLELVQLEQRELLTTLPPGTELTSFGPGSAIAYAVVAQQDGKMVQVGTYTDTKGHSSIALSRVFANGAVDPTFGNAGKVTVDYSGLNSTAYTAIAQPDGKILAVGYVTISSSASGVINKFAVVRFRADGTLDPTFGNGGKSAIAFPSLGPDDKAFAVTLQADGKILVAGSASTGQPNGTTMAMVRLYSNGTIDRTFGTDGTANSVFGSGSERANGLAVQADGNIVVALNSFTLTRFTTSGNVDTSFGTNGRVTTPFAGGNAFASSLLIQPDGKYVVAGQVTMNGSTAQDFAMARYSPTGVLDSSFGSGGKVVTDFANGVDAVLGMGLQPDGKLVAVGYTFTTQGYDFAIARYLTSGGLDTSFGNAGQVVTDLAHNNDIAYGVLVQKSGAIAVAGYGVDGNSQMALARYTNVGQLDTTFPSPSIGRIATDFAGLEDIAFGVAVQPDGYVVSVGYDTTQTGNDFALLRHRPDGMLDTSFGVGGKATTDFFGGGDRAYAVVLQPDGRIVVAGYATRNGGLDVAIARYLATGVLDSSFGSGGKMTIDVAGRDDTAFAIALQTDGKIIVGGFATTSGTNQDFFLARLLTGGDLDTMFGTGGKTTLDFTGSTDQIHGLAIQSDGRIIASGGTTNSVTGIDFAAARFSSEGQLDTTFGSGGRFATDFGGRDNAASSMVLLPDGRMVLAGFAYTGDGRSTFALVRLTKDGVLDNSFGTMGKVTTAFADYLNIGIAIALQSDGKLIVGGYTSTQNDAGLSLARFNADGSLDTTFANGGKLFGTNRPIPALTFSNEIARGIVILPNGKFIVVGQSKPSSTDFDFLLRRFNADGSSD